ncbi:SDR family oxidoreductase [Lactococcus lactis]|uniref:SDR family oxidoreductase n=1 Tax=Lactococcus lactis TaxID=1358 RepID=UPI002054708D|nr:SDR family NAD(P)-dependent oxidoreductase [Lactococcus lactis]BDH85016.1 oxidoreductase [Lactococcus lactis]
MKLENNTILITGGTSGIGLGLAQELFKKGNKIIILGRDINKLEKIKNDFPDFLIYQADVSSPNTLKELKDWINKEVPELNVIINSAGIMKPHSLFDSTESIFDLIQDIQTNLIGTIAVDKILLPQLLHKKEAMIVNISSGLANISSAAHPTYSASKAGVHMFTSALRDQLDYEGYSNVHVMELVPPLISETNLESVRLEKTEGEAEDMKLIDLIHCTLEGMLNNEIRVNAGAAKALRKLGQTNPDEAERNFASKTIPTYFPEGLK